MGEYPIETTLYHTVSNETFPINAGNATTFSKCVRPYMYTTLAFM